MKKNSRIEMAREIIANLKREMDKPRITESVREGGTGVRPIRGSASRGRFQLLVLIANFLCLALSLQLPTLQRGRVSHCPYWRGQNGG
jgi:hypothetical protein